MTKEQNTKNQRYDWQAIRREYRTGQLSDTELCRRYGCSRNTLYKRIRKEKWTRDLSDDVRKEAKAKMVKADAEVAKGLQGEVTPEAYKGDQSEVELAAETRVLVLRQHRKHISDLVERQKIIAEKFDHIAQGIADLQEISSAQSILETMSRIQARIIPLERQAFNLDDDQSGGSTIEDFLNEVTKRNKGLVAVDED